MKNSVSGLSIGVGVFLSLILGIIDIYLINYAGKMVDYHQREFLHQHFSGDTFDWIGIIGFNLIWVVISLGLFGFYELISKATNSAKENWIFFGVSLLFLGALFIK